MKKPINQKRLIRQAINITIHPTILAIVDKRSENGNRSAQINGDLARYYAMTAGKTEITRTEYARLKALTAIGDLKQSIVDGEKGEKAEKEKT